MVLALGAACAEASRPEEARVIVPPLDSAGQR